MTAAPSPRPRAEREAIGRELQAILALLGDLELTGRHVRWNVRGTRFRELGVFFDYLIDDWRIAGDRVGERAVALGSAPDGRAMIITAHSRIFQLPGGPQHDRVLVVGLAEVLAEAAGAIRDRLERLAAIDPATADLLRAIAAKLEEQVWMLRVQAD